MAIQRRTFLKNSLAAATTLSLGSSRAYGANDEIRLGVIGIGSFVKIGGKGRGDMLGPMLKLDPATERFTGPFSNEANRYVSRAYRKPFVVPEFGLA